MVYLLKSIHLKNFQIHRDTFINFDNRPILLITGANGAGKTLILDALLLAMGGASKRAKQMGLSSFIGPFGGTAKIKIVLNNPIINKRRLFQTNVPNLDTIIDKDLLTIEVAIDKRGARQYSINGRKTIDGVPISVYHIQKIFTSVHLHPSDPLFVTEQGTINSFESLTPHKRFEILLESSELKAYLDKLLSTQTELEREEKTVKPLLARLKEEERKLQILKSAYEAYKKRLEIEKALKRLEVELLWSEVDEIDKERAKILEELNNNEQTLFNLQSKIRDLHTEESKLLQKKAKLQKKIEQLNEEYDDLTKNIEILKEEKKEVLAALANLDNEKETYESSVDQIESIRAEIIRISEEIDEINNELKNIKLQKDNLSRGLILLDTSISPYEYKRLNEAISFLEKVKEYHLEDRIIGPLVSMVRVKDEYSSFSDAIKMALRNFLFVFIAMDSEAFKYAKRIFDELGRPRITIIRFDLISEKKRAPILHNSIVNWASNLVEGNPFFIKFLKSVDDTLIAYNVDDPNILVEIAKQFNARIVTQDCNSYFVKYGGFTRPPKVPTIKLGILLDSMNVNMYDIHRAKKQLSEKEKQLVSKRIKLRAKLHTLKEKLDRLEAFSNKITGLDEPSLRKRSIEIEEELKSLSQQAEYHQQEILRFKKDIELLDEKHNLINRQIGEVQLRIKNITTNIKELKQKLSTLDKQYEEKLRIAKEKGIRPESVRSFDEIRNEMMKLKGMLDAIKVTVADKEKYENQKKIVSDLKAYLSKRNEHIRNLREDLRLRIEEWKRILLETISKIQILMNLLLRPRIDEVVLKLTNLENPEKTELIITARVEKDGKFRSLYALSGGERVLLAQAFILSLHILTNAPIQIIDELTQRLDESYQLAAFEMVAKAQKLMSSGNPNNLQAQFILMAPIIRKEGLPKYVKHIVFIKVRSEGDKWVTVTVEH